MTVDRIVHVVVGLMVLLGIALSHFVHPNWIILSAMVALSILQSGFTGTCPLSFVLKKAGVKQEDCC